MWIRYVIYLLDTLIIYNSLPIFLKDIIVNEPGIINIFYCFYHQRQGRLEVYYHDLPLTVQQCYNVLLRIVPVTHYRIYSYLCRMGYILQYYDHR